MKLHEQLKLQKDIETPYIVRCVLGSRYIMVSGDTAALTETGDFVKEDALKGALEWLVDQLGGKVKWK